MDLLNAVELKMATKCPGLVSKAIKHDKAAVARQIELARAALRV